MMYKHPLFLFTSRIHIVLLLTLLMLPQFVLADADPPSLVTDGPPDRVVSYPAPVFAQQPGESAAAIQSVAAVPETIITDPKLDMKILVLLDTSESSTEGIHQAILGYLNILGIPYDVIDGAGRQTGVPLITENDLWDGIDHGHYYAVLISTSDVWSEFSPFGIDIAEKTILKTYGLNFDVRFVTWYGNPSPNDYGLNTVGVLPNPTSVSLTPTGQNVFTYLRPDLTLTFNGNSGSLATPAAGADVTPLLETAGGDTVLAVFRPEDSGEHMLLTVQGYYPTIPTSDPNAVSHIHAQLLPYGMINWAVKGIFLGQRHVYYMPQPDDILAMGHRWDAVQHQHIYSNGFRLEPNDIDTVIAWMNNFRATVPNASDFKIEMPFNGVGMTNDPQEPDGSYALNTLTGKVMSVENQFVWLNHTYSHIDLTNVTYSEAYDDINLNNQAAVFLGFTDYVTTTLLPGSYFGLDNPNVINAAYDLGVRHILVNALAPGYNNPTPNTGIPHPFNPAVLQQPRNAFDIFYDVTTPEEEVDFYNWIFCSGYQSNPDPANRCWDYNTIIDTLTNLALVELLDFNINATMFHMNNINDYGGGRTLMTDFTEVLYGKFNTYFNTNIPILSLRTQEIGQMMRERMDYNVSGARGVIACGETITLTTTGSARVPLTGINYGVDTETYAGQDISYFTMGGPDSVIIMGSPASIPVAVPNLVLSAQGNDIHLAWDATLQDTDGQSLTALVYRIYRSQTEDFIPALDNMIGEVETTSFTDVDAALGPIYHYAVTAVGDNCWKRESEPSRISANPTSVSILDFTVVPSSMNTALPLVTILGSLIFFVVVAIRRSRIKR